jgi:hypothetical protein
MEVHQHTHTPRKKWHHYFWEFLMLFLAVFCGFLAEYKLEHTIEHNREKQYITTLIEDLKSDTAQLRQVIAYKMRREKMVDSLIMYLSSPDHEKHGSDIYYYARNLTRPQYFFPNDRTIQQLKNSGSLRLIRNLAVSDSIMYYDQQVRYLLTLNEDERSIRDNFREVIETVFDGKVFYSQIDSINFSNYKKPDGNPPLFLTDAISINKVVSGAQYLKSVTRGIRDRQERIKNAAEQLVLFLQKEYRFQ